MVQDIAELHQILLVDRLPRPNALRLAGVDLLLDEESRWHLLEINENPLGLSLANELYWNTEVGPDIFKAPLAALCDCLAASESGLVGLLLPYRFRVPRGLSTTPISIPNTMSTTLAVSAYSLVDDFNGVEAELARRGVRSIIADATGFNCKDGWLHTSKGIVISTALNRLASGDWFGQEISTALVNDARARLVCRNKLLARKIVNEALDFKGPVERAVQKDTTVSCNDISGLQALDSEFGSSGGFIITKPNWGGGGKGVRRLPLVEFRQMVEQLYSAGTFNLAGAEIAINPGTSPTFDVAERWIRSKPSRLYTGHGYQFDVRVICIDGRAIFAHARSAAAPTRFIDLTHGAEAAWLTTLGVSKPLSLCPTISDRHVNITSQELQGLISAAEFSVHALNAYCENITVAEARESLPSQRVLFGPSESIVELEVAPSPRIRPRRTSDY